MSLLKIYKISLVYSLSSHGYADDTQLYLSFRPETPVCQSEAVRIVETCITEFRTWLISQKLKFNDLKTEFLIIGTRQQLKKIESNSVRVGDVDIKPVESVRDLQSRPKTYRTVPYFINFCNKSENQKGFFSPPFALGNAVFPDGS